MTPDPKTLAYYVALAELRGVRYVIRHLMTVIAEQGARVKG